MQDILPEQFLSVVNRYKFIEDVRESNLMIVYDKDKEEYISILTKPTQKVTINHRIVIFYQKIYYVKYFNKKNKNITKEVEMLSEEFDKRFTEAIEVAFIDTSKLLEKIKKEYYDQIIEYYFKQAENKIYADSVYIKPHKYFYKDTVMENRYKVNDGHLSFSPPEYFNDPFDCGKCVEVCPQNCINQETIPYVIENKHCLHCGNCLTVCPVGAVKRV